MANEEQLEILKNALAKNDIEIWNSWRKTNPNILVNLMSADLRGVDLSQANLRDASLSGTFLSYAFLTDADLRGVDLSRARLIDADLRGAKLSQARLINTNLKSADLIDADLSRADLSHAFLADADLADALLTSADLTGANLSGANLIGSHLADANLNSIDLSGTNLTNVDLTNADLTDANLTGTSLRFASLFCANLTRATLTSANLSNANLAGANFTGVDLIDTDLNYAKCSQTIFANVDLASVSNLDTIKHLGPSTIGIDTLYKSGGNIPEIFLRGCGVADNMIAYARSLVDKVIDYYSVFISYSTANKDFADLLYNTLQGAGIRCWYAPEQLLPGQRIDDGIHRGIQYWDKVLFCASESSLTEKWWVDFEVDKAFKKSRDLQRERGEHVGVLIPLNLDGYMFSEEYKNHPRASQFETTLAGDFVGWKNDMDKFNREVQRVIKALQTDGGLEDPPPSKL